MAWAAAAGIVVNLLSARLFGDDHSHDLNRRAAVVHLLTDAAVSAAVLISAVLVGITGWPWLGPDPEALRELLVRVMPYVVFICLIGLAGGGLAVRGRFRAASAGAAIMNIMAIATLTAQTRIQACA